MPTFAANFLNSIPWPRGPNRSLIFYRWLLVAVGIYTVAVTWNLWQDRSAPNWHAASFALPPSSQVSWTHRPSDVDLAPMLPVWPWLPQFSIGYLLVASLLLILIRPRTGLIAVSIVYLLGVLMDQTRIQPHCTIVLLIIGTLPSLNAQLVGRASLIALWFWAGFHKLLIDFIKPDGMAGFLSDVVPGDLVRFFPPEHYHWNTHNLGVAVGWSIALTETMLGLLCLFPPARWFVGILALVFHSGIIFWNCLSPRCNLLGWNIALALAGLALIVPWRQAPWVSWKQCNTFVRCLVVFLLLYPAMYYVNWTSAYLSYCIYVPNSPNGMFHRPGENPWPVSFMPYDALNAPLPPGQSILEAYFDKTKRPGDEMMIYDPRPWAKHNGINVRQLTFNGELRNGLPVGHWVNRDAQGNKLGEGDFHNGVETGHWIFWHSTGAKAMEGNFVNGQPEGLWSNWTPDGQETRIEFHDGQPIAAPAPTDN